MGQQKSGGHVILGGGLGGSLVEMTSVLLKGGGIFKLTKGEE